MPKPLQYRLWFNSVTSGALEPTFLRRSLIKTAGKDIGLMDRKFLDELKSADEMRFLPQHLKAIADLPRLDQKRMNVLSETMQIWVAAASAASITSGPDRGSDLDMLRIARDGAEATRLAMVKGGSEPVCRISAAVRMFTGVPR
jgi:hypothetical protein